MKGFFTIVSVLTVTLISEGVVKASTVSLPTANPGIATVNSDGAANAAVGAFLNRIVQLIFFAAIPVAVIAIFASALQLLRSAGDPSGYQKARKNILAILTGFVILMLATFMVRFVISILS